ncbi:hypothetical protein QP902_10010 [Corynebacterium marquesiae]|uniref:hypothetical protein n=1 Tax=Corynebacterium marquesiae TaxID=2913503 RepID=UPI00254B735B|nr:hypothetical protein [Corynebacterium marquesiae]MDK8669005.1 hypothetical protein [Corynebacterium marquesiae]
MSKQDRAAKAIKFGAARGYTPEQIATLLNELNLLAPDAPQPYFEYAGGPVWEVNNGYSIEKERPGEITVSYHGEPAEPITPKEARQLAAADYSEEA